MSLITSLAEKNCLQTFQVVLDHYSTTEPRSSVIVYNFMSSFFFLPTHIGFLSVMTKPYFFPTSNKLAFAPHSFYTTESRLKN